MLTIAVEKRDANATTRAVLKKTGLIPGVVYGAHHESTPISVNGKEFGKMLRQAGEATIVSLEGLGASLPTLIHEIDFDPLSDMPRHVDFYAVTKGKKVEVAIPLTFIGESAAVEAGANLVKVMYEVEVEADPMNLPQTIEVDISALKVQDDQIHINDLKLPEGVTLVSEENDVVVLVQAVVEEVEEVAPVDLDSIDVEKKGKEEGEEEASAEAEKQ